MRIVRDYVGLDRTTVVYHDEITGVGGTAEEFFVIAEVNSESGSTSARTKVEFSHEEMSRILAEYRRHYPIDGVIHRPLLEGPRMKGVLRSVQRRLSALLGCRRAARRPAVPSERRDGAKPFGGAHEVSEE